MGLLLLAGRAEARSTYFKHVLQNDAARLRPGELIEPRYGRDRLRYLPRSSTDSRVERLFERARLRVAPSCPSRIASVFATDRPELWSEGIGAAHGRLLVRLAPLPRARIAMVDATFYEKAHRLLEGFDRRRDVAAKRKLVARVRRLAERYWTEPARGQRARPEILLGGGATYLGRADRRRPAAPVVAGRSSPAARPARGK